MTYQSYRVISDSLVFFSSPLKLVIQVKTTHWATKKWDFLSEQARESVVFSWSPLM